LIVTDVAARGIDIPLLDVVINYDFPPKPKTFVHRVGRVARAGRSGVAYSLVSPNDYGHLVDLMLFLGKRLSNIKEENEENILYYGNIPSTSINLLSEDISKMISFNFELQILHKNMNNSYKLYYKTRPAPSPSSVNRGRELDKEKKFILI